MNERNENRLFNKVKRVGEFANAYTKNDLDTSADAII